jgi:hypothetical protein
MRQRNTQAPHSAEETVRDIRRATRQHFSTEEKIRIVLECLRGGEGLVSSWSKPVLDDINNYACRCRHEIEVASYSNPLPALRRAIRQPIPVASLDHNILAPRNALTNAILFCNSRR